MPKQVDETADRPAVEGLHRYSVWLVFVALVVACAAAILLWSLWDAPENSLEYEAAKTLLELLTVGFGGAVLGFLASQYQARQADVDNERELSRQATAHKQRLLRSVLDRTTSNYNGVKRARRLLRAQGRQRHGLRTVVVAEIYDLQLVSLNDIQLEFETLSDEVQTERELFTRGDELRTLFDDLEEYLGRIVSEYEDARPRFGNRRTIRQCALTELTSFLDRDDFHQFSSRFHAVQEQLRKDLAATSGRRSPDPPLPAVRGRVSDRATLTL
jgi:hypothetical protein